MNQIEETSKLCLDFKKISKVAEKCHDVIPCAVQDVDTKEVILIAYVNKKALDKTIETKKAVFWSTSRNELWEKGFSSGNTFSIIEIRVNCEQNSLLYIVKPDNGKICHTKNKEGKARNCFYRRLNLKTGLLENLDP